MLSHPVQLATFLQPWWDARSEATVGLGTRHPACPRPWARAIAASNRLNTLCHTLKNPVQLLACRAAAVPRPGYAFPAHDNCVGIEYRTPACSRWPTKEDKKHFAPPIINCQQLSLMVSMQRIPQC